MKVVSVDRYVGEMMGFRVKPGQRREDPPHRFHRRKNPSGGRGMKVASTMAGLYLAERGMAWE